MTYLRVYTCPFFYKKYSARTISEFNDDAAPTPAEQKQNIPDPLATSYRAECASIASPSNADI
jgi:hypothetical protein